VSGRESQILFACDVSSKFNFAHASYSQHLTEGVVGLDPMSRLVLLDKPSLCCLLDDVVSVVNPRVPPFRSEELVGASAVRGREGFEGGRGLLEEAVGARGTAAGTEVMCVV